MGQKARPKGEAGAGKAGKTGGGGTDIPPLLTGEAAIRWAAIYPELAARGPVDRARLTAYCQVWKRWKEAEELLGKVGQVSVSDGKLVESPLVKLSNSTAIQVERLERQLGLDGERRRGGAPEPTQGSGEGDPLVTRRELAALMGVHMQTVTKWERDGMPIAEHGGKGRTSRYRVLTVRAWRDAREAAAKSSGHVDVAQERARKEKAQAILAEQTFEIRRRDLVPRVEVERVWSGEVAAVRAVILASYTTHADRVFRASTLEGLPGVERTLKELAYDILRELANPDRAIEVA